MSYQVDIEIEGRPPYQVSTTSMIPNQMSRSVLPGASLELRVDPTNPQSFAIVVPGQLPS